MSLSSRTKLDAGNSFLFFLLSGSHSGVNLSCSFLFFAGTHASLAFFFETRYLYTVYMSSSFFPPSFSRPLAAASLRGSQSFTPRPEHPLSIGESVLCACVSGCHRALAFSLYVLGNSSSAILLLSSTLFFFSSPFPSSETLSVYFSDSGLRFGCIWSCAAIKVNTTTASIAFRFRRKDRDPLCQKISTWNRERV